MVYAVWVLNAPLMKPIDGGKTFEKRSAPHGDHHDMWFNPENSQNFINGNDGGATVTFNGGTSWSSIMNQPTAQFYRVITDNQTPFRLYAGQQDNSSVSIASRTFDGGIGQENYFAVGGGESAHIAFDPEDPRLIYATTIAVKEQAHNIARYIVLDSKLPSSVSGIHVNRYCSGSLQANAFANASVMAGDYDVVLAGGGEHLNMVQMGSDRSDPEPSAVEAEPDLTEPSEEPANPQT